MALQPLIFKVDGGVNYEKNEEFVQDNEAREAWNLIFGRGVAKTRPPLTDIQLNIPGGDTVYWADSVQYSYGGSSISLVLIVGQPIIVAPNPPYNKLYVYNQLTGVLSEITPKVPGGTFYHGVTGNAILYNGYVIIGGVDSGLLKVEFTGWDTTTGTWSIIGGNDDAYTWIVSFNQRIVGILGSHDLFRTKIGWCASGDETDWTGASAGSTVIAEATGAFQGISVVRNTLVLQNNSEMYLGYPTGTTLPVFRFEKVWTNGIGLSMLTYGYPLVVFSNVLYFIGTGDIYKWAPGSDPVPIGEKIRQKLFAQLSTTLRTKSAFVGLRLFVSQIDLTGKFYLNIVPTAVIGKTNGVDHYCFDMEEGTWSIFKYSDSKSSISATFPIQFQEYFGLGSGYLVRGTLRTAPAFLLSNNTLCYLAEDGACEQDFMFRSKLIAAPPQNDLKVSRCLIKSRDLGSCVVDLTLTRCLNKDVVSTSVEVDIGSEAASGKMVRSWGNVESAGNDFEVQVSGKAGSQVEISSISLLFTPAGEYRGE